MLFSPDFFHFFESTAVLLEADPSLWCVSSWNDNGQRTFQWDRQRLVSAKHKMQVALCFKKLCMLLV